MPLITFAGRTYQASSQRPLLETLLSHRLPVPHSCRSGYCHSCLMKVEKGNVPACSQQSLNIDKVQQGYFLACLCRPEQDMEISLARRDTVTGIITGKTRLTSTLVALDIAPRHPVDYQPGQLITLWTTDSSPSASQLSVRSNNSNELARPCYLASLAEQDKQLTVHIQRRVNGQFSQWAHDCTQIGQKISISDVRGTNIHQNLSSNNLIVVQDGCLAPILPLLRRLYASPATTTKTVQLVLQVDHKDNLYGMTLINRLAQQQPDFTVRICCGLQGKKQLKTILVETMLVETILEKSGSSSKLSDSRLIISGYQDFIKQYTQQVQMDILLLPYS